MAVLFSVVRSAFKCFPGLRSLYTSNDSECGKRPVSSTQTYAVLWMNASLPVSCVLRVLQVKVFLIAKERDVRGAMALMEQGVDPNTKCPERDYTPLIAAVFNKVRANPVHLLSLVPTHITEFLDRGTHSAPLSVDSDMQRHVASSELLAAVMFQTVLVIPTYSLDNFGTLLKAPHPSQAYGLYHARARLSLLS